MFDLLAFYQENQWKIFILAFAIVVVLAFGAYRVYKLLKYGRKGWNVIDEYNSGRNYIPRYKSPTSPTGHYITDGLGHTKWVENGKSPFGGEGGSVGIKTLSLDAFFTSLGYCETMTHPADSQIYNDGVIGDMNSERWKLQEKIVTCTDVKKMGELYWKIEEFEEWYRDRVPDGKLIEHVNGLYDIHARVAKLLAPKVIKEAPVSTGS